MCILRRNIPMKEPGNIPDPYVKLYLLPGRAKDSKRKTSVIKDNCYPEYDANFEYLISMADLLNTELEVKVATQKGFLSGGSPVIGMVSVMVDCCIVRLSIVFVISNTGEDPPKRSRVCATGFYRMV